MKPVIGVVGAGPAGLFAAIHAARAGASVLLWDSNPGPGRKLAVTGNGRGNLSNSRVAADAYACDSSKALQLLLSRHDHAWLRRTLFELGVLTFSTEDGWCYPISQSAAAVAGILNLAALQNKVAIYSECKIVAVQRVAEGFVAIDENKRTFNIERIILASGGKAHPQLGANDSGLRLAEALGITILAMRPALAPLVAEVKALHKLQGVRLDVQATLYDEKRLLGRTTGNLIFTQYGVNGPAAMNLSYLVDSTLSQNLHLGLNLLPYALDDFNSLFKEKAQQNWPLSCLLESALPRKLAAFIQGRLGWPVDQEVGKISVNDRERLYSLLTDLRIKIQGAMDFQHAQLAAGGAPLSEIDPQTMASRRCPGVYLAGEILDVTGPCGGFNLHFAFASGAMAGIAAAQECE
jgi:predicted Rossmann fold flavoprotein